MFLLEWVHTGNMTYARFDHTASVLNNGKVLVTGGSNENGHLNSAELYDPLTDVWITTGNLTSTRTFHTASVLNDGIVLVTGGVAHNISLNSGELYNPSTDHYWQYDIRATVARCICIKRWKSVSYWWRGHIE
jgi:hypothetical protein